jgi:K+ transporter
MNNVIAWAKAHPKVTAWLVLAVGMVAIIVYEARDVGLLAGQWAALIIATISVAGLCVWIIGWEEDEDEEESTDAEKKVSK